MYAPTDNHVNCSHGERRKAIRLNPTLDDVDSAPPRLFNTIISSLLFKVSRHSLYAIPSIHPYGLSRGFDFKLRQQNDLMNNAVKAFVAVANGFT